MFVGVLLGSVITFILSRLAPNIPYTVVVFLVGIVLAIGATFSDLDVLGDSLYLWDSIEPEVLLFVFLPALLFGDAMTVNIHHVKRTFSSALLLAGPGSLAGTFLLGAFCKVCLPYNWSWKLCWTFGAILCATDPVAVVAVLKQAGASPRLTILVVQEALYNDGAALVLFNLFFDKLLYESKLNYDIPSAILYFIRVLFISPLVGIALGLGTVFGLAMASRRLNTEDVTIQVALTICCAYLSFFVGEYMLHVSGVLCCCFAEQNTMNNIWETIEWFGNTLIFLLAGTLIVSGSNDAILQPIDFAMVIVVYLLIQLVRALLVILFYPFLMRWGLGVSLKEALFLSWAGLRGAVSITLALILTQSSVLDEVNISQEDGHRVFFLVGGVAALTLVVNATLAKKLLYYLGLVDNSSPEILIMQHYARKRIYKSVLQMLTDLNEQLPAFDEHTVAEFCKIVTLESILKNTTHNVLQRKYNLNTVYNSPNEKKVKLPTNHTSTNHNYHQFLSPLNSENRNNKLQNHHSHNDNYNDNDNDNNINIINHENVIANMEIKDDDFDNVEVEVEDEHKRPMDDHVEGELTNVFNIDLNSLSHTTTNNNNNDVDDNDNNNNDGNNKHIHNKHVNNDEENEEKRDKDTARARDRVIRDIIEAKNSVDYHNNNNNDDVNVNVNEFPASVASSSSHLGKTPGSHNKSTNVEVEDEDKIAKKDLPVSPSPSLLNLSEYFTKEMNDYHYNSQNGDDTTSINLSLLVHVRAAFLNVVRAVYWKHIEEGKLPRNSASALALLYSIDVGHDTVHTPGLQDWDALQPSLTLSAYMWLLYIANIFDMIISCVYMIPNLRCSHFTSNVPSNATSTSTSGYSGFFHRTLSSLIELRRQENGVYILSSFIEAHEYAQEKIPYYLGEEEGIDTPELALVVQESVESVTAAKAMLADIDADIISYNVSKQVARILLHTQQTMVEKFQEEGVLCPRDADILLIETHRDYVQLQREWLRRIWMTDKVSHIANAQSEKCGGVLSED
eukprot:gene3036-5952_t